MKYINNVGADCERTVTLENKKLIFFLTRLEKILQINILTQKGKYYEIYSSGFLFQNYISLGLIQKINTIRIGWI